MSIGVDDRTVDHISASYLALIETIHVEEKATITVTSFVELFDEARFIKLFTEFVVYSIAPSNVKLGQQVSDKVVKHYFERFERLERLEPLR